MSNIDKINDSITSTFNGVTIKNKIVDGIKVATEKLNVKLVNEEWGQRKNNKWHCACALGCMLIANNVDFNEEETEEAELKAAEFLGVSNNWINSFIAGFDAGMLSIGYNNEEAYRLGIELRNAFNVKPASASSDEVDE